MKISAEVREFAKAQEAKADLSAEALAKAEAGMAQMSKRFHDEGGELYVPAD